MTEVLSSLRDWESDVSDEEPRDGIEFVARDFQVGKAVSGLRLISGGGKASIVSGLLSDTVTNPWTVIVVDPDSMAAGSIRRATHVSDMWLDRIYGDWTGPDLDSEARGYNVVFEASLTHRGHGMAPGAGLKTILVRRTLTSWQESVRDQIGRVQEAVETHVGSALDESPDAERLGFAVAHALADSRWDFQTVPGLAREAGASEGAVRAYLDENPSLVRWVPARSRNGHQLLRAASVPIDHRERRLRLRAYFTKSF